MVGSFSNLLYPITGITNLVIPNRQIEFAAFDLPNYATIDIVVVFQIEKLERERVGKLEESES